MKTAICPVGDHEFLYEFRRGQVPRFCPEHRKSPERNALRTALRLARHEATPERRCPRCEETKPSEAFTFSNTYCKSCAAAYQREWLAADPDRHRRYMLARYGLTPERFDAMLAEQGGRCAVCHTDESGGAGHAGPRGWHVDHDAACCNTRKRSCGKCVRGLLCASCNLGLGSLQDSTVVLTAAINYLDAYRARRRDAEGHTSSL